MNTTSGNYWARSVFVTAVKVTIVIVIEIIIASAIKLADPLHPPHIVTQGETLRKYKINYRSVDLITKDGISLAAWSTPPQNGVVILLADGSGTPCRNQQKLMVF